MKQHQDREKLEAIIDYLDPHNKDINPLQRLIVNKFQRDVDEEGKEVLKVDAVLTPDMISLILQKIQLEISLDVRDLLYDLNRAAGISKWGSKLGTDTAKVEHKLAPAPGIFKSETILPSAEDVQKSVEG